ncbi:hypothetical protein CBOM_01465 [Ceraceosorus bombacis]|uniref:BAR domain n=1 Tax=Ceraceosorus bombacis TaxID=401625 RepID=A0A0P1BDI0_9BASI|nr:hypothetical protein CBOM_01465 [Ceraceosorus bombacis]
MENWKAFTQNISANVGPVGQRISRGFGNLNQQAKERFGTVDADDITELPQEYKDLEQRVDALRSAHTNLLKIARAYESEGYDYPTQVQESIGQLSQQIGHSVTSWASSATKGTSLPAVQPTAAPPEVHRTLAHALSRGAASGALELGASPTSIAGLPTSPASGPSGGNLAGEESKLGEALQKFALAQDRVGNARLAQDDSIRQGFLQPWQAFGAQITVAIKARQAVRDARLHLDSWRQALKAIEAAGNTAKLDSHRQEVEAAEDKLVEATEAAIASQKAVLENPEGIKSLAAFVKAQSEYHQAAAQVLAQASSELANLGLAAESDYRATRA